MWVPSHLCKKFLIMLWYNLICRNPISFSFNLYLIIYSITKFSPPNSKFDIFWHFNITTVLLYLGRILLVVPLIYEAYKLHSDLLTCWLSFRSNIILVSRNTFRCHYLDLSLQVLILNVFNNLYRSYNDFWAPTSARYTLLNYSN
jgi:hypothetical protein